MGHSLVSAITNTVAFYFDRPSCQVFRLHHYLSAIIHFATYNVRYISRLVLSLIYYIIFSLVHIFVRLGIHADFGAPFFITYDFLEQIIYIPLLCTSNNKQDHFAHILIIRIGAADLSHSR